MPAPASRLLSFRARAGLLAALAPTVLSAGGCTLLVDVQLAEKREETGDAGGQDSEGGDGGSSQSTISQSSSSSGGLICPSGFADCDEVATNGCEVYVKDDPKNCGWCKTVCQPGKKCTGGSCK